MPIKFTTEYFKNFVENKYPGYSIIDEYKGVITEINFIHNECGTIFLKKPHSAINRNCFCPVCCKNTIFEKDLFTKWLKKNRPDFEFISEYTDKIRRVVLKHNCGNLLDVSYGSFRSGKGCPKCNGGVRKTHEEFTKWMHENRSDYKVVGVYKNSSTKIEVVHEQCKKSWFVLPGDLIQFVNCPHCHISKGEQEVEKYLIKNNIKYEREFKFKDCKNIKELKFDFLVKYNDENILIEYQGIQHYEPVKLFGGIKKFEASKKRDLIKKEYCEQNNIKLICIKYNECISNKLNKEFN